MARYVLLNVLNNLGNFPPASGARRLSSIVAEDELLDQIKAKFPGNVDVTEFLRYFIFDDSVIFGVIDLPFDEGGEKFLFKLKVENIRTFICGYYPGSNREICLEGTTYLRSYNAKGGGW
jgi:hypothetical protein